MVAAEEDTNNVVRVWEVQVSLAVQPQPGTRKVVILHTIIKDMQHRAPAVLLDIFQDTEGQTVVLA
jgi:hypothetical protein